MNRKDKIALYINQIDTLIAQNVDSNSPNFQAWKMNVERLLSSKYGPNSYEFQKFSEIDFSIYFLPGDFDATKSISIFDFVSMKAIQGCRVGLESAKKLLILFQEDFETGNDELESPKAQQELSKIFVIHGHNGELKQSVARIIERQGIEAIILSEKANCGKTIIEKIEENSDVGAAICLFTADDFGKEKDEKDEKFRSRQNVVFETGYFMGKLGREHIVILADKGIEMPSDLSGIVYTDTTNWEVALLKELKAAGYAIDFNKLY